MGGGGETVYALNKYQSTIQISEGIMNRKQKLKISISQILLSDILSKFHRACYNSLSQLCNLSKTIYLEP